MIIRLLTIPRQNPWYWSWWIKYWGRRNCDEADEHTATTKTETDEHPNEINDLAAGIKADEHTKAADEVALTLEIAQATEEEEVKNGGQKKRSIVQPGTPDNKGE
jgi:hypothetical protein